MSNSSNNYTNRRGNRLSYEKSPYLLQHAHNPVDWYTWGKEAFQEAYNKDKPIFLSIGYSTCHWCHVMERESFDDPQVARLLNETFVCIKVDREERPDIDNVYMSVCQILTGSGGWPLTVIMTPTKKPFYAATYIPKNTRFGRTGLMELIPKINAAWDCNRSEIEVSADNIIKALQKNSSVIEEEIRETVLDDTYESLVKTYDETNGGFGSAPKFPAAHNLLFLLRYWKRNPTSDALQMVEHTLQKMRQGGIYDHIGFGFHRYSTDAKWLIPHFEKMLYDQALSALAYISAYQITTKEIYKTTSREILNYVLRELTAPQGVFYSAIDADSDGKEGRFYFWSHDEIKRVLGKDADFAIKIYNIRTQGNLVDDLTQKKNGENILHLKQPHNVYAEELQMTNRDYYVQLEKIRQKLFASRKQRTPPYRDDKVLTDWNGLMIAAFARASRVFGDNSFTETARRAADFILNKMRSSDGLLFHRYRNGEAALQANIDDYAFLIWGLIELYEVTFEITYLANAIKLNSLMMQHFLDDSQAGFYFTPDYGEQLLIRQKRMSDGAIPSGSSIALMNLVRLGRITGDASILGTVDKIASATLNEVKQTPHAHVQFMSMLDLMLTPAQEIVIVGDPSKENTKKMLEALTHEYLPNAIVLLLPSNEKDHVITKFAPQTKAMKAIDARATAYICINNHCQAPTNSIDEMLETLKTYEEEVYYE
ncbi:MAG: thioredoxin domain-containing protein [bacterium]